MKACFLHYVVFPPGVCYNKNVRFTKSAGRKWFLILFRHTAGQTRLEGDRVIPSERIYCGYSVFSVADLRLGE